MILNHKCDFDGQQAVLAFAWQHCYSVPCKCLNAINKGSVQFTSLSDVALPFINKFPQHSALIRDSAQEMRPVLFWQKQARKSWTRRTRSTRGRRERREHHKQREHRLAMWPRPRSSNTVEKSQKLHKELCTVGSRSDFRSPGNLKVRAK